MSGEAGAGGAGQGPTDAPQPAPGQRVAPSPTWWQAADGLFYPPHLHPNYERLQIEAAVAAASGNPRGTKVDHPGSTRSTTLMIRLGITAVLLITGGITKLATSGTDDSSAAPPTSVDADDLATMIDQIGVYHWRTPADPIDLDEIPLTFEEDFDDNGRGWAVGTESVDTNDGPADVVTAIANGALTVHTTSGEHYQAVGIPKFRPSYQLEVEMTGSVESVPGGEREAVGVQCRTNEEMTSRVMIRADRWVWLNYDDDDHDPTDGASGALTPAADGSATHSVRLVCASFSREPNRQHTVVEVDGRVVVDKVSDIDLADGSQRPSPFTAYIVAGGAADATATVDSIRLRQVR